MLTTLAGKLTAKRKACASLDDVLGLARNERLVGAEAGAVSLATGGPARRFATFPSSTTAGAAQRSALGFI